MYNFTQLHFLSVKYCKILRGKRVFSTWIFFNCIKVSFNDWQLDGTLNVTAGNGIMILYSATNSRFVYDDFLQKQVLATNGVKIHGKFIGNVLGGGSDFNWFAI